MPQRRREVVAPADVTSDNSDTDSVPGAAIMTSTAHEEPGSVNNTPATSRRRQTMHRDDPQQRSMTAATSSVLSAACDQCRTRKIRCDRRQPKCSSCHKAGIVCSQTNSHRRVNHSKQLRDDFSSVLGRLDDIETTLGVLTELTKQFAGRPHRQALADQALSSHPSVERDRSSTPCLGTSSQADVSEQHDTELGPGLLSSQPVLDRTRCEAHDAPRVLHQDDFLAESVELEHGGKRAYKLPASMALLKSLRRKLAGSCHSSTNIHIDEDGTSNTATFTRAAILRQLDCFPFRGKCIQPVVSSDRGPIYAPPHLITRLLIEGFLQNSNSRFPIFDNNGLREAVDVYYHPSSVPSNSRLASLATQTQHAADSAWAVIFTNIALLELGLDTQVTRWQHGLTDSPSISPSLLAGELISSLFRNCDRALEDLTAYTRPSLLNIQALLTLALVAQEFYGNVLFEKILHTTCHVARMLGLHVEVHGSASGEESEERWRVFRVLYAMDKQRVFLTGDPCDLYHFDSDLDLWKSTTATSSDVESPSRKLVDAFDDMMIIWEEVYLNLYSARATAAGAVNSSTQVINLLKRLSDWRSRHSRKMETRSARGSYNEKLTAPNMTHTLYDHNIDEFSFMRLELAYCYHVTHVLILRCSRRRDQQAQAVLLSHARSCLRVIVEMSKMRDDIPNHLAKARLASLGRVLRTYPVAAFIDLVAFHLDEMISSDGAPNSNLESSELQDVEADIELMNAVLHTLHCLQHVNRKSTYLNRLRLGLEWATRVVMEMRRVVLRETLTADPLLTLENSSTGDFPGDESGSTWNTSSVLQQQQQPYNQGHQERQQEMLFPSSEDIMDVDMSIPPSAQLHAHMGQGFPPSASGLVGENTARTTDARLGDNWSATPHLNEVTGDAGWKGPMPRKVSEGCAFYGLKGWQDFFLQSHETSRERD